MINHKLSLALVLGYGLVNCYSLKAQEPKLAKFVNPLSPIDVQEVRQSDRDAFEPPPKEDAPAQTTGGGSRNGGRCLTDSSLDIPLTALLPSNGLGLTSSDRPTLPVYIPATTAKHLELSLVDANQRGIYQTTIQLPAKAQIVGIKLPKTAPALKIEQNYSWSIALICDPSDRLQDWVVKGKVKRIQLQDRALKRQLELTRISSLQYVDLYRKAGLWYETVSALLIYQRNNPNDSQIKEMWQKLLAAAGLEKLTTQQPTIQQ